MTEYRVEVWVAIPGVGKSGHGRWTEVLRPFSDIRRAKIAADKLFADGYAGARVVSYTPGSGKRALVGGAKSAA